MDSWLSTEPDFFPLEMRRWSASAGATGPDPAPIPSPPAHWDQAVWDQANPVRVPATPPTLAPPDHLPPLSAGRLNRAWDWLAILQDRLVAAIARRDRHRQWLIDYRAQGYSPSLIATTEKVLRASDLGINTLQEQIGRQQQIICRYDVAAEPDAVLVDFAPAGTVSKRSGTAPAGDQPLPAAGVAPKRVFPAGDPQMATLHRLIELAETRTIGGRLTQATRLYRQAGALAQTPGKERATLASYCYVGLGAVLYEQNDLAGAAECLGQALTCCARADGSISPAAAYAGLAQVKQAAHETAEAGALFTHAMDLPPAAVPGRWEHWTAGQAAHLALAFGEVGWAANWAQQEGLQPTDLQIDDREGDYLILARLLLAQDAAACSLALVSRLREAAAGGRIGRLIEIGVLEALARGAQGDAVGATTSLADALALAEPEGYIRVFVDAGPALAPWLYEAAAHGVAPQYAGHLLALLDSDPTRLSPPSSAAPVERLSAREQQILHLLAAGLTNAEIAGHLVLALPTVKRHLNNLYGKLDARSRTQAVARAHALQLL